MTKNAKSEIRAKKIIQIEELKPRRVYFDGKSDHIRGQYFFFL